MEGIGKVAVMGGGAMGGGIAQVVSQAGYDVVLKDIEERFVQKGLDTVRGIYRRLVEKGRMNAEEAEKAISRVKGTISYDGFNDVDLVIEAVPEVMSIKKQVFSELEKVCPDRTIFCSNTSSLSISEMAASTRRPDKFCGMHFFNPANVMRLVEIIPALQTSAHVTEVVMDFTSSLGKVPVLVQECAGFLVNRIMIPWLNEAARALTEGAASAKEIDNIMVKEGYPMGPFVLMDFIGMDVGLNAARTLYESYGSRHAVSPLVEKLVAAGRYGKKTGKGFYDEKGEIDAQVRGFIEEIQKTTGVKGTEFSAERLILREVNEAVYCLQEGVATVEDIDKAVVLGTGFPHDKVTGVGGPLHWADEKGLDWCLERLEHFKSSLGERFWPHPLLKRYVAAGWLGRKTGRGFFIYK